MEKHCSLRICSISNYLYLKWKLDFNWTILNKFELPANAAILTAIIGNQQKQSVATMIPNLWKVENTICWTETFDFVYLFEYVNNNNE